MSTLFPADACEPVIHIPPPTAKTVREVEIEKLLRECLPYVLVDQQPTEKTNALVERITRIVG